MLETFLGRELAQQKDFSEHTQQIIDEEIQKILLEMEHKVEALLYDHRTMLDTLAEALLENETLDKKQIDSILDKVNGNGISDTRRNITKIFFSITGLRLKIFKIHLRNC